MVKVKSIGKFYTPNGWVLPVYLHERLLFSHSTVHWRLAFLSVQMVMIDIEQLRDSPHASFIDTFSKYTVPFQLITKKRKENSPCPGKTTHLLFLSVTIQSKRCSHSYSHRTAINRRGS